MTIRIFLIIVIEDDTPAMKPLDKADTLIQKHSNLEWFPKKSGLAKRTKKFKELIQKDELTIADFEVVGLERLNVQYNNDVELGFHHYAARYCKEGIEERIPERWSKEVHHYHFEDLNGIHHWDEKRIDFFKAGMSVITKRNVFSDLRIKSVVRIDVKKKWGYGFLTSIVVRRSDDKEYEFNYADLPRLSVNVVEDMYLLKFQDKLHHLPLEFVKDFSHVH
ncbi:hypothetical protein Tco_1458936 [Tanacetum coccineum]